MRSPHCSKEFSCRSWWGIRRWSSVLSSHEGGRIAGLKLLQCERVMWGAVNRKISQEVEQLTENCWVWWEFRRASIAWGTKIVKGETTTVSSVALTKRTVAVMALRQGGYHCATRLVADYNALWVDGGPPVLWWVPQGHSLSFYILKGKENLVIGMPKCWWVY